MNQSKWVGVLLTLVLAFSAFAGCTNDGTTTVAPTQEPPTMTPASSPEVTEPAVVDPTVITVMMQENNSSEYMPGRGDENEWVFNTLHTLLLRDLNVDYKVKTYPATETDAYFNTLMASDETLPDLISYWFSDSTQAELYEAGKIIALDDLVNEYAPLVKSFYDTYPNIYMSAIGPDGALLRVTGVLDSPGSKVDLISVRQDWLDRLELDTPETFDDFYEMLKAFQENDMNDNGLKDEVLVGSLYGCSNLAALGRAVYGSFGGNAWSNAGDSWYYDESGTVYNEYLTEECKQMLMWFSKLYSEGLLYESYDNLTNEQFGELVANNKVAASFSPANQGGPTYLNVTMVAYGYGIAYRFIDGLVMNEGDSVMYPTRKAIGRQPFYITTDCEHPETAIKVLNYGLQDQIVELIERLQDPINGGSEYKLAPPQNLRELYAPIASYTNSDKYNELEDRLGSTAVIQDYLGMAKGFVPYWAISYAGNFAMIAYNTGMSCEGYGEDQAIADGLAVKNLLDDVHAMHAIEPFYIDGATADETQAWSGYADLWTYMDETAAQFVSGAKSIADEWDSFIGTCESMDIAGATAIMQARYDRYLDLLGE